MPAKKTSEDYLVIGAGKMGGALLSGWLSDSVSGVTAENLIILDPRPGDDAKAVIKSGARHIENPKNKLKNVAVVLLAIKPQAFKMIAPPLAEHLPDGALVISILAGTSIAALQAALPNQHIVRAMPNTPAAIGEGITAFTCTPSVTERQKRTAERLLSAGGKVHEVENEGLIDVVTAVSGSGPAYVFHMVEALEAAAVKIGLPAELAPDFARQTIVGAGALLKASPSSATELRQAVTSPNGTTQAALDVLMSEAGLAPLMRETAKAALRRAKELAKS
ncbi:MAG: pyrroline-5-carboxylate reductase [Maricaulaceae bacterium]